MEDKKDYKVKEIRKNMTICIGLICNNNSVIVASDKKITASYPPKFIEKFNFNINNLKYHQLLD